MARTAVHCLFRSGKGRGGTPCFVWALCLGVALVAGVVRPSGAEEAGARARIAVLEEHLDATGGKFSFDVHNELRHLYGGIDESRSLHHSEEILKHMPMQDYILAILGDWKADKDPDGAVAALIARARANPRLPNLAVACLTQAGLLCRRQGQEDEARRLFEEALALCSVDTGPYRPIVAAHLGRRRAEPDDGPWTVKVLSVRYFPLTPDGLRTDLAVTSNVDMTLEEVRAKCDRLDREVGETLEEGSRFRAYRNPAAPPSLRYEIVGTIEIREPMPHDPAKRKSPDYQRILERIDARRHVEDLGVKEIWLWGYHSPDLGPWESNMASPWGDVSNSDRDPADLPIFSKTYTVYHYNYQREASEATENHMHQIEAMLGHHGPDLFRLFTGEPGRWRCGNCHFPPNGKRDYDWANPTTVLSDIEDWRPEGRGEVKELDCRTWNADSRQWFVYWMRSLPGAGNGLTWKGKTLTNWWRLVGDYDAVALDPDALAR